MKRSILRLEAYTADGHTNTFRTVIKTKHGRVLFLLLKVNHADCTILDCFYIDRNQGRIGEKRYSSKPLKLKTFNFPVNELLLIIKAELDKKFYGIEYVQDENADLSLEKYLKMKTKDTKNKYRFLIMVGDGSSYNGLPVHLCTRLKNKLHRSVFVELEYYKNGSGVVKQCYYYDRKYKRKNIRITPPQLISCFFPYSREGILNLLNNEICCDFTHIIVTDEIDVHSNTTPVCGAL